MPTDSVYRTFWNRQNPSVGIEIRIVVALRWGTFIKTGWAVHTGSELFVTVRGTSVK